MRSIHISRLLYSLAATLFFLGACSKMNDLHDKYLQRGETIYTGKPDSVKVFAGKERVKLRYWSSDPKAVKLVVYWLLRTDSIVFDIPPHLAKDSVEFIIPNLPEYNYSFELVTANKYFENRSVTFQVSGSSYGDKFQSSLLNRVINYSRLYPTYLEIKWMGAVERAIGCELVYVNPNGDNVTRFVPITEKTTLITDFVGEGNFRTLFLPEKFAIDTFYTALKPLSIEDLTK